jgi:hypothetical protein
VTRLGDFSPVCDCLGTLVDLEISEVAFHIFGLLFPAVKLCIKFDRNVFGYILGNFLTNPSGHHGFEQPG